MRRRRYHSRFTCCLVFQSLPSTYEEAALVDGAGYFKTMISVMIPIARPSIIAVILFNFLAFWNEYIIALTLIPGPNKTLPVGLMNLMAAQKSAANYGQMYAGMVLVMLPTLILYIIVQKINTRNDPWWFKGLEEDLHEKENRSSYFTE